MPSRADVENLGARLLARWRDRPDLFALDVFGMRLWHKQLEIMQSVLEHERTAVRSGHKCSKTTTAVVLAWWWASTRPRALVILTAPSHTQVDDVLWNEVTRLYEIAQLPLGGKLAQLPSSGWKGQGASGERRIIGFSTDKPERAAGFSGPETLIIIDESSGFNERIYEALIGNLAGGAKMLALSNPTQTSGWYFDAFNSPTSPWHKIHMSSRECAESWPTEIGLVDARGHKIKGLATMSWCDTLLAEYGPDDPRYLVRVLGEFATESADTMVPRTVVDAAVARYASTRPAGPLCVGVDTARFGNDHSSIIPVRGLWAGRKTKLKGCDNVVVADKVMTVVRDQRNHPDERVSIRIDTSNNGGVADIIRHGNHFAVDVVELVASASSPEPQYSRLRDFAWQKLREWLDGGGAIPDDRELKTDVCTPKFGFDEKGRIKVESKKDMRKRIGRSTDDADALALAVFPDSGESETARLLFDSDIHNPRSWT